MISFKNGRLERSIWLKWPLDYHQDFKQKGDLDVKSDLGVSFLGLSFFSFRTGSSVSTSFEVLNLR